MKLELNATTRAERAIEAIHNVYHEHDEVFHNHNFALVEDSDETAPTLYLEFTPLSFKILKVPKDDQVSLPDGPSTSDPALEGGSAPRTGIAILAMRRCLRIQLCIIMEHRLVTLLPVGIHELPYKGTTIGEVLELIPKMMFAIPASIIQQYKDVPLIGRR